MPTLRDLIQPLIEKGADLRLRSKVNHESCCAAVALKLQAYGFEAHPLRVQIEVEEKMFDHCVILAKNDESLSLRSFKGTDYVLVELIPANELRELYAVDGVTYKCENVKESLFNPLQYIATLPKLEALLLTHAFS